MKKRTILISFIFVITIILCFSIVSFLLFSKNISGSNERIDLCVNVVGFETNSPGDCILISYGDTQILIDSCQSKENFDNTIKPKMQEMMANDDEKVWEYMIFTHPDKDHIGNAVNIFSLFYGTTEWSIGTIIDFDFLADELNYNKLSFKNSFYSIAANEYIISRNLLVSEKGVTYFSASSLNNNNKVQEFVIDENVTLNILYNYYDDYEIISNLAGSSAYVNNDDGIDDSLDAKGVYKNLISVCTLIEYYNEKLLFTGDLPEYDSGSEQYNVPDIENNCGGETMLIENHPELIKNVTFYKAGHHGSSTSNSEDFIDYIRPGYVAITKGPTKTDGYPRYPYNVVLNNILKYTDYITISKAVVYDNIYSINGDVTYVFNNDVNVSCQYNNIYIRESNLYSGGENTGINFFEDRLDDAISTLKPRDNQLFDNLSMYFLVDTDNNYNNKYTNTCTLIKYGHYDILIDCGSDDAFSNYYANELKNYVRDGIIEYLIVSHHQFSATSQIAGPTEKYKNLNGILDEFKVLNLIDSKETNLNNSGIAVNYGAYREAIKTKISEENYYTLQYNEDKLINITDKLSIKLMSSGVRNCTDENEYSMSTLVKYRDEKYLFVGDLLNYKNIINRNGADLKDVTIMRLSSSIVNVINDETNITYNDFKTCISFFNPKNAILVLPSYEKFSNDIQEDAWYSFIQSTFNSINNKANVYINNNVYSYNIYYEYNYNLADTNSDLLLYKLEEHKIVDVNIQLIDSLLSKK